MRRLIPIPVVIIFIFCAIPLRAQVRYGGYLSFEYVKGQRESEYPQSNLENIQAGFLATGQAAAKFGFALEVRTRSISLFQLEEAWVGFLPAPLVNIKAGLFLVPFGLYNRASRPHQISFIRTPLNFTEIYPSSWRDLGLLVEGRTGVLTYSAYIGNGLGEAENLKEGQLFKDNNSDKGKGGRLGLVFRDSLEAGFSYYAGKFDDAGERKLTLTGVDVSWVTPEWEVRGEYTRALLGNPEPFEDGRAEGYTVWTSMFIRNFHPIGSFQKLTYEDPFHGPGFSPELGPGTGIFLDRTRWTAGFSYILGPGLVIKFEYDWNKDKDLPLKDNVFQVQAALSF